MNHAEQKRVGVVDLLADASQLAHVVLDAIEFGLGAPYVALIHVGLRQALVIG